MEFLILIFVYFLLTKLLFGVIRDLNGLWCSTENIYSIYWRSMPALLFDFELRLRLCSCRAAVSVYGWERAKVSVRYFSARSMIAPSPLYRSRSLCLPLFARFACSTDFILELHLMTLNLQKPKGRKREKYEEHSNANNIF